MYRLPNLRVSKFRHINAALWILCNEVYMWMVSLKPYKLKTVRLYVPDETRRLVILVIFSDAE